MHLFGASDVDLTERVCALAREQTRIRSLTCGLSWDEEEDVFVMACGRLARAPAWDIHVAALSVWVNIFVRRAFGDYFTQKRAQKRMRRDVSLESLTEAENEALIENPVYQRWLNMEAFAVSDDAPEPCLLSGREREVLQLFCTFDRPQDVAQALGLKKKGVQWHLTRIYKKLGTRSLSLTLIRAIKEGWVIL